MKREGRSHSLWTNPATGALNNLDVAAKRLQILKEAVPKAIRAGMLVNETNPEFTDLQIKATHTAAEQLGITIDVASSACAIRAIWKRR